MEGGRERFDLFPCLSWGCQVASLVRVIDKGRGLVVSCDLGRLDVSCYRTCFVNVWFSALDDDGSFEKG